jgi:hypothetical protein
MRADAKRVMGVRISSRGVEAGGVGEYRVVVIGYRQRKKT